MTTVTLSTMQQEAVDKIKAWYAGSDKTFVLAGYAGTGKTFMINEAMEQLDLTHVVFATFTGKASLVLKQKLPSGAPVMTLHKFLYTPMDNGGGAVEFVLKDIEQFSHLQLVVVDECSMVSKDILTDLMKIGVKVLFIGDHGQLPPVGEVSGIYHRLVHSPDAVLTEIHRQSADNPIIQLSMLAREKKAIPYGVYGENKDVLVIPKRDVDKYWSSVLKADQVICGYNKTRTNLNHRIRQSLGFQSPLPAKGDKMICLRNNWEAIAGDTPLVNGLIGYVQDDVTTHNKLIKTQSWTKGRRRTYEYRDKRKSFKMSIMPDFCSDIFHDISVLEDDFTGNGQSANGDFRNYDQMDYGYAITCHKSQGSEWDKVFVYSEVLNKEDHSKWLYTAITRASKKLIIAL